MPDAVDLQYAFGLQPEAAVEYFRSKGHRISWDWYDTWQEAQARAFTVAKVVRLDILEDIRGAVDSAISNGTTFAQFKKDLMPTLKRKGWWGRQTVINPSGVEEVVQLGSVRRLSTIYRTNLQTAYMAGRYKAMLENADERPFWQYIAIDDGVTRDAHRKLHRSVFRFDDPIWQSIYPPNDWGCRCRIRALTADQVRDKGLTVETSSDRLDTVKKLISERTGELADVTRLKLSDGTYFETGPGWNYNPGQAHWQPDLDRYPYETARQYIEGALTGPAFVNFYERTQQMVNREKEKYPQASAAQLRQSLRAHLSTERVHVAVLDEELKKILSVSTQAILLSQETLVKQIINRDGQPISMSNYQSLHGHIKSGTIIQENPLNLIFYFEFSERLHRAVVKRTLDGSELFLTSLHIGNQSTFIRDLNSGTVLKRTEGVLKK